MQSVLTMKPEAKAEPEPAKTTIEKSPPREQPSKNKLGVFGNLMGAVQKPQPKVEKPKEIDLLSAITNSGKRKKKEAAKAAPTSSSQLHALETQEKRRVIDSKGS